MYRSKLKYEEALKRIETELERIPEIIHWIDFCKQSKRGLISLQGALNQDSEMSLFLEESDKL